MTDGTEILTIFPNCQNLCPICHSFQASHKYSTQNTSIINIAGKPIVKYFFFVLCLNVYIPAIVPIPPPNSVIKKNVFSGILHFIFYAFFLSMPIAKNPIIFIISKYISIFFNVNISSMFSSLFILIRKYDFLISRCI